MKNYDIHELNRFAFDMCDILEIERMPVIRNKDMMLTDTMLAMYATDSNTMFINPDIQSLPDLYFAICHELRHVWQRKMNPSRYFDGYKDRSQIDIESYNLQLAELDANAFAAMIMIEMFNLKPLFNGLNEDTIRKIMDRKRKLTKEYFV